MAEYRKTVAGDDFWFGLWSGGGGRGQEIEDLADDDFYDEEYDYPDDDHEGDDPSCATGDPQTCCRYCADPLVRRAVSVADSVDRALGQAGDGDCAAAAADLARMVVLVSGLLAQIHAVLPGMDTMSALGLLCPLGRLSFALGQVRAFGCPWACGHPGVQDRRAEMEPLGGLLQECASVIAATLGFARRPRWGW